MWYVVRELHLKRTVGCQYTPIRMDKSMGPTVPKVEHHLKTWHLPLIPIEDAN